MFLAKARSGVRTASAYRILHGVLFHVDNRGRHRIYVPDYQNLRSALLYEFHDLPVAGHLGWRKCFQALGQNYYWPGMSEAVHEHVIACPTCQRIKTTVQPKPELHALPVPSAPFRHITLDWLSGFPVNVDGHDCLLNIIDRFSKWAIVIPCTKTMTVKDLIDVLWVKVFSWIGLPESIIGDRDSRLTASRMRELCKALGTRVISSTAYHPQTDGQTENFHRTLLSMLRAFVNKYHSNWESLIPSLYAYHNTFIQPQDTHDISCCLAGLLENCECHCLWQTSKSFQLSNSGCRIEEDLKKAGVSLEHARTVMIDAHKAAPNAHQYASGNLVKVSTPPCIVLLCILPNCCLGTLDLLLLLRLCTLEQSACNYLRAIPPLMMCSVLLIFVLGFLLQSVHLKLNTLKCKGIPPLPKLCRS